MKMLESWMYGLHPRENKLLRFIIALSLAWIMLGVWFSTGAYASEIESVSMEMQTTVGTQNAGSMQDVAGAQTPANVTATTNAPVHYNNTAQEVITEPATETATEPAGEVYGRDEGATSGIMSDANSISGMDSVLDGFNRGSRIDVKVNAPLADASKSLLSNLVSVVVSVLIAFYFPATLICDGLVGYIPQLEAPLQKTKILLSGSVNLAKEHKWGAYFKDRIIGLAIFIAIIICIRMNIHVTVLNYGAKTLAWLVKGVVEFFISVLP